MKLGIVSFANSFLDEIDSGEMKAIKDTFIFKRREISMIYAGCHDCLLESDLFDEIEEGQRIPRYSILFSVDDGEHNVEVNKEENFQTI